MDPYLKLRPWTAIDACECPVVHGLLLVDILTDNPLHCEHCRKEVDPGRLQLATREVDAVASWRSLANALYLLWLDSGEYEAYAKARLLDMNGQVNREGLAVATLLSERIATRLWVFRDVEDGEPTDCPRCTQPLDTDVKWGIGKSVGCRIHI